MATAGARVQTATFTRRKVPLAVRRRRILIAVADHSILIALSTMFLAPFVFITLTALMSHNQALSAQIWPHPFRWSNFVDVFHQAPVWRWFANTLIYSGLATIGVLVSSIPVAYALARLRWRGRNAVFMIVLIALMLPPQVSVVPLYVMWSKLHLVGTLWPLIIPNWLGDAFSIFLLRQFMLTIPEEYLDAARVDGCGELRILTTVVLRLAKPAIAAVALFQFLYCWNDFYNPLLYTGNSGNNMTLAVGLTEFTRLAKGNAYEVQMAASLLFLIPVVIIFFFAQRVFIEGVTLTGVKG